MISENSMTFYEKHVHEMDVDAKLVVLATSEQTPHLETLYLSVNQKAKEESIQQQGASKSSLFFSFIHQNELFVVC